MTTPQGKTNKPPLHPFRLAGVVFLLVVALVVWLVYLQYRGDFSPKTTLQMLSARAGLVMDAGSKVTYNGVQIGQVTKISEVQQDGKPAAKFLMDVDPQYIRLIPANVDAKIVATTLFGNKYVSLTSPKNPTPQRISPQHVIDARHVTTEINTLLATVASITAKVDPVKLNLTLSAAAEAFRGLGDKFGQSIVNADAILDEVNPLQSQARHDIQQLAALFDTYANGAPDLFDFLNNAATTAHTLHAQQKDLDAALLAAVGLGNTGADIVGRGGPYLQRAVADLVPTTGLLDTYSPELFCAARNIGEVEPRLANALGKGDGYALDNRAEALGGFGLLLNPLAGITGAALAPLTFGLSALANLIGGVQNPYVYPDNLPRNNARGGPGGAPGCWQRITRDLWPGPYLVMDNGASVAPYNHLDVGSPLGVEYVWGRQWGENTINP
ncbi:MCE family protein [Candidatus Mycobacterium methanotrophicum]|uniref:MCE family protein n=1 Tax=Candidatus Mycobacterium methanotrophicum TaxID=2943498 RepID=A0ABY4QJ58_9MYCO|nr:MCE family protein [Candidatus Mycobacterium methanotrophicum]UQX10889.1 MCE family protein [Candidatus Mycobacterium methanotrophicum]